MKSGFVITTKGAVVTNYHVIEDTEKEAFVVYLEGRGVFPVMEVLAASKRDDLAILQIGLPKDVRLPPVPIQAKSQVRTPISVISHPSRRFYTLSKGFVCS